MSDVVARVTVYSPARGDGTNDDSPDLSRETVFDLVANQRRCIVLSSVADGPQSVPLAELADDVARCEYEKPLRVIPHEDVQSIQTSLHHHHLPKLADVGVVEYDHDRGEVRSSGALARINRTLGASETETLTSHRCQITTEE